VDFSTLKARKTSWIQMPDSMFRDFVYFQAAFFATTVLLGTVAHCGPKDIGGFLTDPNVVLDFILVIKDLANMHAMNSLNALRIIRLLTLFLRWHKMENLKEVMTILKRSFVVTISIIGVLLFCLLFLSMVLKNLIVATA
jgi:Ion transport protein